MDLLFERTPEDLPALKASEAKRQSERLTFGFARGTDEGDLIELVQPRLAPSSFQRDCFESDLFLDELVDGCFSIVAEGRRYEACRPFLKKILVTPPRERSDAAFRQRIFKELVDVPDLARGLEKAYVALRVFRAGLAGSDGLGGASQTVRRRVDILVALQKAVRQLGESFSGARSGLERILDGVHRIESSEEYVRLEKLLAFENERAVLESRLQLGYDGTLRRFDIVQVTELEHPGFAPGRGGRFFRRLFAFLRGDRFSEEDVMSRLLDQVFSALEPVVLSLLRLSLEFEFYLGGLAFKKLAERSGLAVCVPEFESASSSDPERAVTALFNPWLLAQGKKPVPCDLARGPGKTTVIVTGPNSGGKTRFLQAISVTQLLGQVGLFVPAASARLVWVDQLFLSLLERTHAAQEEGRLGMELLRIRKVFETSGSSSLIVMDELCSGTNPSEGEEIFEMVLGLLEELRPQVFISTHFLEFAERLAAQKKAVLGFLQVELGEGDVPTYQFVPGVAKTSLAHATAGRLGVTRDELARLVVEHKRRNGRSE